ncbi:hypothetical protein ACTS9T_18030 [Empedobacter falsenii]
MKIKILGLSVVFIFIFSCKKDDVNDKIYPQIKNEKVKTNLIRYKNFEIAYLQAINNNQLDLRRIYSDSTNYYDSLINTNSDVLNDTEFYFLKSTVDSLKKNRIEALKKINN